MGYMWTPTVNLILNKPFSKNSPTNYNIPSLIHNIIILLYWEGEKPNACYAHSQQLITLLSLATNELSWVRGLSGLDWTADSNAWLDQLFPHISTHPILPKACIDVHVCGIITAANTRERVQGHAPTRGLNQLAVVHCSIICPLSAYGGQQ